MNKSVLFALILASSLVLCTGQFDIISVNQILEAAKSDLSKLGFFNFFKCYCLNQEPTMISMARKCFNGDKQVLNDIMFEAAHNGLTPDQCSNAIIKGLVEKSMHYVLLTWWKDCVSKLGRPKVCNAN